MVRGSLALCAGLLAYALTAQDVRINEVLCGHRWDDPDRSDRLELYNAGRADVDLGDFTITLNGASQRITGPLIIPAHGHIVLWCDRHPERGNDHLDLKLPRTGGSALLIAPDRMRVLDLFTWPALPPGVSMGRVPDGTRTWGYFEHPDLGAPNLASAACKRLLHVPTMRIDDGRIILAADAGAIIRYTTDGTTPDMNALLYADAIVLHEGQVLRARAFATDGIPSEELVRTAALPANAIALTVDPSFLWGDEQGLFAKENYARLGRDWERPAMVEWPRGDRPWHVGLKISGSGTRSAPKKNLKLLARTRFGDDGLLPLADGTDELILRADATPHALLRNLFMEAIAIRSGRHVDVQPSTVLPLYVNGQPFGTYRAMPAKNTAWVEHIGHAEAVDLIDGPGGHVITGSDDRYEQMLALLKHGAPIDSLERLIDVASLIDLACFDLWTGRADHDLNVRCWRPRTPDGRFRWILYDMDLWAAPDDPTVDRMVNATSLEAPYLDQVLAQPVLRERLLERMSALLATTLAPARTAALADSLFRSNEALMHADHDRWKEKFSYPTPEESLADLQDHIAQRTPVLLEQLARHTGTSVRSITVDVEPRNAGVISMDGAEMTRGSATLSAFTGTSLQLTAIPAPGMEFVGWKGIEDPSPSLTVRPGRTKRVRAVFRPSGLSRRNGL